jgi:hypothetical protein
MLSFACLEDEAYKEIRRLSGTVSEARLDRWQLYFFEAPSYYTYSEIRDNSMTSRYFRWGSAIASFTLLPAYAIITPVVIGYFVCIGIQALRSFWHLLPYGVAIFFALFSSAQYFENLTHKRN